MAKFIITVVILLVLLVGAVIMLDNVNVVAPSPSSTPTEVVATVTPDHGTIGNIRVLSPVSAGELGFPAVIKGEARTFEAAFSYRIKSSKGDLLLEGHGMTTGTAEYPDFRPFEVVVSYPDPKTATGSLEVFEYSAKDGSEINKVIVPVLFKKDVASTMVKLYFPLRTDEKILDFISRRIPKSDTPVRASLDALLVGIYKTENPGDKYTTAIGADVKINSVALKSGVLTIDLSGTVSATAKAQFSKTALQSTGVKSVVVLVNGKAI